MLVEDIELDQELRTAMSKYSQQYNQSLNNSSFFNEGDNPMNETKQPFAIKSRCNII